MISRHNNSPGIQKSVSSPRDVIYSCGSCGYALNLNSASRNTSNIDSKYGKTLKKGKMSFFSIDESRFTLVDELKCLPFFSHVSNFGLFQRRTKLLCRKCRNIIGYGYGGKLTSLGSGSASSCGSPRSPGWSPRDIMGVCKEYSISIRSLQPSLNSGVPLIE